MSGADLAGADLSGAKLTGAQLRGADCRNASFRGAALLRTSLSRADLANADFSGATLREVSALDAKNVETIKADAATSGLDQLQQKKPDGPPPTRTPRPSEFKWRDAPKQDD